MKEDLRNFISGSTALRPERIVYPKAAPNKAPKRKKYAKIKYAPSINAVGFVALMSVAIIFSYSCIGYLEMFDNLKKIERETVAITRQIKQLKIKNDSMENYIYSKIDLEEIRKIAIEEFGMIYPFDSQVIRYKNVKNGYVRQYGELKEAKKEGLLEKFRSLIK